MANNQPTIPVKKSDGTTVRMTMDEFKLYKSNLKNNLANNDQSVVEKKEEKIENITPQIEEQTIQPISQSVVESPEDEEEKLFDEADTIKLEIEKNEIKVNHDLPVITTEQSLANTTPVKAIFVDEAIYKKAIKPENQKTINQQINKPIKQENNKIKKQENKILSEWGREDHRSLLEENDEDVKKHQNYSPLPVSNSSLVDKIISQLDFEVEANLQERLKSLILSRIKDIRDDDQIFDYAVRKVVAGGLGLGGEQAKLLVGVIKKSLGGNKLFNNSVIKKEEEKAVEVEPNIPKSVYQPQFQSKRDFLGKPTLQDVIIPPKNIPISSADNSGSEDKKTVGPIDELRTFDLKDWRRLSNNPVKSGEELLEKFWVLKKDSFVLFMEGSQAWRQSPLYKMYKDIIAVCVSQQKKVKDYLFEQDKSNILTPDEFDELVKVNRNLV